MSDPLDRLDFLVLAVGTAKTGRVLLRARRGTLLFFALDQLSFVEDGYERFGGLHVGQLRVSPKKVNWQAFRIAVPERYPSANRDKGYSVSVSANCRLFHLQKLAEVIEASGRPWTGFQRSTGARWLSRESLLKKPATVSS